MKTAVFYEHILEGAKQSGKSVAELMEKCASWNIRGIEIGDALLRENKEEIKELLEKNHMQVSCSNAFYDFGHHLFRTDTGYAVSLLRTVCLWHSVPSADQPVSAECLLLYY